MYQQENQKQQQGCIRCWRQVKCQTVFTQYKIMVAILEDLNICHKIIKYKI